MSVLLKFLFSEENLAKWLRPEWLKLYDPAFVDEELIGKVLVFVPQVQSLQVVLEGNMAKEAAKKEAAAEAAKALAEGRGGSGVHTTPEPFNLTRPNMRLVPPPEDIIDTTFKAAKVPASTYAEAKDLVDRIEIDKAKDRNRLKMKAQYSDPRVQPFKLRVLERPSNLDRVREEVVQARDAENTFHPPAAKPVPKQLAGQGAVRLNTGAILREDNLYRQKQEKEARLLGTYESELRDTSEFDAWQHRMRTLDEDHRVAEVERRRVETLLADEEAKEAKHRQLVNNQHMANATKAESGANAHKRQQERQHRVAHQRGLVVDVQAQREKPALAAESLALLNRERARSVRDETERLEVQAAEERRGEEARRADMIRQIRALELVPRKRIHALDPTYTPQIGLLEEMSLAELRERLRMNEEAEAEKEALRRAAIVTAKQEREADLARRVHNLSAMRELSVAQATERRERLKEEAEAAAAAKRERVAEAQLKLHAQIEAKRRATKREDAALAAELKAIKIKNQFLGADKEAVERKKWESQQAGQQREIVQVQREKQHVAVQLAELSDKETLQRRSNLQREREEHEAFLAEYERRCKEQGYDAQAAADAVKTSRQVNVADELSRRSAAAEIRQDEWQYATEITRAQKEQRQAAQQKQLAALAKEQAAARTRRSMLGGTGAGAGTGAFGGSVASTSRPAPPAPADARSRSGTLASR